LSPQKPLGKPLEDIAKSDICVEFGLLTNNDGLTRRDAVKQLAQRFGLSAKEVYRRIEEAKTGGE
jgi:hypothetical protein